MAEWEVLAKRGARGPRGPEGPPGTTWRGSWQDDEVYNQNDIVEYDGSTFIAASQITGAPPQTAVTEFPQGHAADIDVYEIGGVVGPKVQDALENLAVGPVNIDGNDTTIQLRRATPEDWSFDNPILEDGEKGIESGTNKEKTGDGVTRWAALAYSGGGEAINSADYVKSRPNGVPNVALGTYNPQSAVNGLEVQGSVSGRSPVITNIGADASPGLVIRLKGTNPARVGSFLGQYPLIQVVGAPSGPAIGGIIVGDSVHNPSDVAPYGGGLFNGAVQAFRPATGAQSGMPWFLLGDEFGQERTVVSYCHNNGDYFTGARPADGVLRTAGGNDTDRCRLLLGTIPSELGHTAEYPILILDGPALPTRVANHLTIKGRAGTDGPLLVAEGAAATQHVSIFGKGNSGGVMLGSASGARPAAVIGASTPASAVNYVGLNGAATGQPVVVSAAALSADTDVDLRLQPKGAGFVDFSYAPVPNGLAVTATMGNVGGSGPLVSSQNSWLAVRIQGITSYIPIWR